MLAFRDGDVTFVIVDAITGGEEPVAQPDLRDAGPWGVLADDRHWFTIRDVTRAARFEVANFADRPWK